MKTKFTPGPWIAIEDNGKFYIDKNQVNRTEIEGCIADDIKSQSDAALIAAAPEMYNLLEKIEKLINQDANGGDRYDSYVYASGVNSEIDKLLRKARGE